jgi:hypothetical protein
MSTPPELPPPLPAALPSKNGFQQLALASWTAPLLGVVVNILMISAQVPAGSKVHIISGLFCLAGFVFGIIAFFGIPKYGAKGILGHAIAGVSITGLIIFFAIIGLAGTKERRENPAQARQEGANSFLDYPGWFGQAQISGGIVGYVSINELSPASNEFNSHFSRKLSIVTLIINNMAGTNILVVDPFSLKMINGDGSRQNCETANEVASTVIEDRVGFMAHYGAPVSVPPGQQSTAHWGFFASGTDFSKAIAMAALINGKEVSIGGQFLTPEQKQEMFKRGQQLQNENKTFKISR